MRARTVVNGCEMWVFLPEYLPEPGVALHPPGLPAASVAGTGGAAGLWWSGAWVPGAGVWRWRGDCRRAWLVRVGLQAVGSRAHGWSGGGSA